MAGDDTIGRSLLRLGYLSLLLATAHLWGPELLRLGVATGWGVSAQIPTDPVLVLMAGVRLVALALGWYLMISAVAVLLVRRWGGWRSRAFVRRAVPRALRGLVGGLVGSALLAQATTFAPVGAAQAAEEPSVAPILRILETGSGEASPLPQVEGADQERHHRVAPDDAQIGVRLRPRPHGGELRLPFDLPRQEEHVVVPGESFWSIAQARLLRRGRAADDREVAAYWCELIAANEDRLVVAGDPDLLLPGQHLVLPQLPATGANQEH